MLTLTHGARRRRPARHRDPLPAAGAFRRLADRSLVRRLLLRLGCGERRVPDGERGVPARDPRDGDRVLLRRRHRPRRDHRPGALREADRLEELHRDDGRLPDRRRLAARRGGRRVVPRRRRRGEVARGGRGAALVDRHRRRGRPSEEPTHANGARSPAIRSARARTGRRATRSTAPTTRSTGRSPRSSAPPTTPDRPLPERELLARTNARHWGPGVARRALRRAVRRGPHRARRDRYVAARAKASQYASSTALRRDSRSRQRKSTKPAAA